MGVDSVVARRRWGSWVDGIKLGALIVGAFMVQAPGYLWAQTGLDARPTVRLLAPGVISTEATDDLHATFTPDGRTVYFVRRTSGGRFTIMFAERGDDGRWSEPRIAPFSGRYADQEPYVSPDGDRLYFTSDRPSTGTEPIEGRETWVVELIDGGWSEPRRLEAPVRIPHSAAGVAEPGRFWGQARGPSEGPDGALYFWAERPDSRGETDLYRAPPGSRPGVFGEPQNLGPPVNTQHFETAGVLSPDGRTLVFGRDDPEGLGLGDLFVSRRTGDGWSEPRNLGAPINSSAFDFAPRFSPDGRRLYFSSNRSESSEGAGLQNLYYVEWPVQATPVPDRRVALTFDDLPMTGGGDCAPAEVRSVTAGLTRILEVGGLPAAGLATPGRECLSPALLEETLGRWLEIGAVIGNHTATHPDLNGMPIESYLADIERGQAMIDAAVGTRTRWFRPPYLHSGDDPQKKAALSDYLAANEYRLAPVTVDNQEWVYAAVYADARAQGNDALARRVVDAYVAHLEACMEFYEALSVAVFDREIPQILLLHANRLNADHLDRVIGVLEDRGYRFVTLPEALADSAYARADSYVGSQGLSWLQRWALAEGVDVPPEPREAAWVADAFRRAGAGAGAANGAGGAPSRLGPAATEHPPVVLPGTHERTLRSTINGVDYKLYVSLPNGYDPEAERYPVVYLLDADYSFAIGRNIVEHLSDRGHLTPAILVGIAYAGPEAYRRHRTRDYTPTHTLDGGYGPEYQAHSGGGPRFLQFISDELIPFIEDEYHAAERRVLVGHSYGGLFVTWSLLNDPSLFDGYIAVSPSLWYDDHWIFEEQSRRTDSLRDVSARVYMTVGDREINSRRNMVEDLRRFATTSSLRDHPGIRLRWSVESDETHNSIFPGALSDGLRFVLQGR